MEESKGVYTGVKGVKLRTMIMWISLPGSIAFRESTTLSDVGLEVVQSFACVSVAQHAMRSVRRPSLHWPRASL